MLAADSTPSDEGRVYVLDDTVCNTSVCPFLAELFGHVSPLLPVLQESNNPARLE